MSPDETSTIPRDGQWVHTKLGLITERARRDPKCKFSTLAYLLNEGFLLACFRELKVNKAPGIDGVTVRQYEENLYENVMDLVSRLKSKKFRPQPARRAYIPKDEKSKRPLGILVVEDKIVQMGMKKILEAIYEADFRDVSYGFRPGRSCHDALEVVDKAIMREPVNYIVDMDIEKYFDSVEHRWMMECLKQRINDPSFLRLITRFLKAGIMEEGNYMETDRGTQQGGIVSPVLANIYLHYVLDLWYEKKVKKERRGYTKMIRYADDFIVCFENKEEAEAFGIKLRERLAKFGLRISETKSRTIAFGRKTWQQAKEQGGKPATFDFLGFTHYCTTTRKGRFRAGRQTSRKKFAQKLKVMNLWLKEIRNEIPLEEWWRTLRKKLVGHYQYYGISGNMDRVRAYYRRTELLAFKWINRRSQKKSMTWGFFRKYLSWNPLPVPKIYHRTYTLSVA
jgi:RNA-directed DNA polymerase